MVTELDSAPLVRRLAALLYEGVLLFGVVMLAGLAFGMATGQKHALHGQTSLRVFLFFVIGAYFVYFWTHGGQTLAMKTWRLRVENQAGEPLSAGRASMRYLLAWLWFLPALAGAQWAGANTAQAFSVWLLCGLALYLGVALLLPKRQLLHDWLCGTRVITYATAGAGPGAPQALKTER